MARRFLLSIALLLSSSLVSRGENLLQNGDFEQGTTGWSDLWTRTPGGRLALDTQRPHGGRQSLRIEHSGSRDWSFQQQEPIQVVPGQIYELSAWVRVQGEGSATLCVTPRNAQGQVLDWAFAARTARAAADWRRVGCRFIVPPDAASMLPRLIGNAPATVWFDNVSLALVGSLDRLRSKDLPERLTLANKALEVALHTSDATLVVRDRRTDQTWQQKATGPMVVLRGQTSQQGLTLQLLDPATMLQIGARIRLDDQRPEITVELSAEGELTSPLAFPPPLATSAGSFLIMPVNEGISYPVDDQSLEPMSYYLYGGHGLCMPWHGQTDGRSAVMTIVETPDDAAVRVPRRDGLLCLAPEWMPQKQRFGPPRRLRYVFFDQGGYVAMCKRYRAYAQQAGLLKTLAEKRAVNPYVDMLVGAVNVWCWDQDPVAVCREMQALDIQRILWSKGGKPELLKQLNEMNVLTSRYDIYQDTMDPANFPKLRGVHSDWTTAAWPNDLTIEADGQWERGWGVEGKDGRMYPCGVLCDRQAVEYARLRIPPELKTHPYRCRFIDTTTASPWRECYHPDHPMTRSDSRRFRMDLLRYVSDTCELVTGSETGHDAAVPYVHYFEGMLSLGPYRVLDSGRRMLEPVHEVPGRVAKFQTGHYYRLPLWELVYHDCVIAQWYWGDYNNKLPVLWDRRDLLNALYGTPPMFMFNRKIWQENRDRFVKSYQATAPIARATGYAEMLSHEWLTADHSVQQTRFANGVTVTVNLGDKPHTLADGAILAPLAQRVAGLASEHEKR